MAGDQGIHLQFEDSAQPDAEFPLEPLSHCELTVIDEPGLYAELLGDKTPAGQAYWDAVFDHAKQITSVAFNLAASGMPARIGVIDIPRGGVPAGLGVVTALADKFEHIEITNVSSRIKTDPANLYPEDFFDDIDMLVIADGIVATGGTILRHLEQIPEEWSGAVVVLGNAMARLGIDNINSYARENDLKIRIVTGHVYPESQCAYVDVGGKQVYFVGGDDGIPDFGEKVSPPAPARDTGLKL